MKIKSLNDLTLVPSTTSVRISVRSEVESALDEWKDGVRGLDRLDELSLGTQEINVGTILVTRPEADTVLSGSAKF